MQTLPDLAIEILEWECQALPRGGYRILNARLATMARDIELYTERIDAAQFYDELACVKAQFVIVGGIWAGMWKQENGVTHVLAFRLE